jgi:NAD(P)-dependent dehydrogenase (short-subunit alcohol dehydrogenase family)
MHSLELGPDDRPMRTRLIENQYKTKIRSPPTTTTFAGKTALITGSNTGLGYECARVMLDYGLSHLIIAVRSKEKGEAAAKQLQTCQRGAKIEVWLLDMLSYDSIQSFAKRCEGLQHLDIAILNAGLASTQWKINQSTGHETVFQVNYLSTALLSLLLLPTLKKATGTTGQTSHLSIISSFLGCRSAFSNRDAKPLLASFDKLEGSFTLAAVQERYNVSKTLSLMLTVKLGELVDPSDVIVNCLDPGYCKGTELSRDATGMLMKFMVATMQFVLAARTPEEGAWTYVDAVTAKGKESHGSFLHNCKVAS